VKEIGVKKQTVKSISFTRRAVIGRKKDKKKEKEENKKKRRRKMGMLMKVCR